MSTTSGYARVDGVVDHVISPSEVDVDALDAVNGDKTRRTSCSSAAQSMPATLNRVMVIALDR
jgi:hypothetical protein